jgi:steroid 5-alpha reductase family enzyme
MSPGFTYLIGIIGIIASFAIVWAFQLRSRSSNMVDVNWTFGLGAIAIFFAAMGNAPPAIRVLYATLATLWSLRLGVHVFRRNHHAPEDPRYAKFRERWGAKANRNLFWFYQFQTIFSALLALPFLVIAFRDDLPPPWAVICGVVVWLVAVGGEALSDRQLAAFRRDPANKGQVNRNGLWRYSRHPNYFFECLQWFTYCFLAVGSGYWWVGLIAPATMALLLLKLSGIPITEEHLARTRPGYAEYIRTTSAFIPWPPRADR